jgi:hypothetical protein
MVDFESIITGTWPEITNVSPDTCCPSLRLQFITGPNVPGFLLTPMLLPVTSRSTLTPGAIVRRQIFNAELEVPIYAFFPSSLDQEIYRPHFVRLILSYLPGLKGSIGTPSHSVAFESRIAFNSFNVNRVYCFAWFVIEVASVYEKRNFTPSGSTSPSTPTTPTGNIFRLCVFERQWYKGIISCILVVSQASIPTLRLYLVAHHPYQEGIRIG